MAGQKYLTKFLQLFDNYGFPLSEFLKGN